MKFRGMMVDSIPMKEFSNTIITLSKLAKDCVLKITENNFYFIVSDEENGPSNPTVWCEMESTFYFKEYQMEGITKEFNEIYLEFAPTQLSRSLVTLRQGARSLKVKLTNKSTPCLTIEIELSSEAKSQQCVHDIPVKVIPRRMWSEFQEPRNLNFNICIAMPGLKAVKNIVEHLKSMSPHLIISANKNGRLTLCIEKLQGSVSAHFPNLEVQSYTDATNADDSDDEREENNIRARVDIKKVFTFLTSQQISYSKVYCGIVEGSLVRLYLEYPGAVKLQCFVPEISH